MASRSSISTTAKSLPRPSSGRERRQARVTSKRSLENYLYAAAIREVSGIEMVVTDDCHVADLIARESHMRQGGEPPWDELPRRTHTRRRNRVKKWLVTKAAERMTPERLAERDPDGEVRSWLDTIAHLAQGPP